LGSAYTITVLLAVVAGFLILARRRWDALFLVLAVVGTGLLNSILKLVIQSPRPVLAEEAPEVFTSSFPSGHAALSAATYLAIAMVVSRAEPSFRRYTFTIAGLLSLLAGLTRIYLGVHWPSDVVAGWFVGAAWVILIGMLLLGRERSAAPRSPWQPAGV
jgi:undecaprenyl-diphosphatase